MSLPFSDSLSFSTNDTLLPTYVALAAMNVLFFVGFKMYSSRESSKKEDNTKSLYPPMFRGKGWSDLTEGLTGTKFPEYLMNAAAEIGSYVFRLPIPLGLPYRWFQMTVIVGDPALAREILSDRTTNKPRALYYNFDALTSGPTMFSAENGPFWAHRRKGVALAFSTKYVRRMNEIAIEETEKWIDQTLEPSIQSGNSFLVSSAMTHLLLSSIMRSAFEYEMSEDDTNIFIEEADIALKEFTFKSLMNPLRQYLTTFLPERQRAFQGCTAAQKIARKTLEAYRQIENPVEGTIMDKIEKNPHYANDEERLADMLVMMVAGMDTTSYSLSWTLQLMAQHSDIASKLREELRSLPQTEWETSPLLKRVIQESMRLYPVASGGSLRETGRDFHYRNPKTKQEVFIPAHSAVMTPLVLSNRNPDIFEQPGVFDPSRWENATKEQELAAIAFSVGSRDCIGQRLAMAELYSIIPRLLVDYEFEIAELGTPTYFLTWKPGNTRLKARRVQ